MNFLTISGVTNFEALNDYFASSLVDIAYIESIDSNNALKVRLEDGIDLSQSEDREWIINLISQALNECNEFGALIKIPSS